MIDHEQTAKASRCPSCGGALRFDEKTKRLSCGMCGSSFHPGSIELIKSIGSRDSKDAEEDSSRHEIVCDSCGAVAITDENTSASFCPFCGSHSLVAGRLRKEFKPDYIIPFTVTKDQAKKIFLEWAGKYRYAPDGFLSEKNVSRLTGLYVPFWLINADCSAKLGGVRYITDKKTIYEGTRMVYSVDREISFGLKNVPFDASKKINDRLMEAVEPFDWSGLREYGDGYLPGFYAERYDTNALEMSERIMGRLEDYTRQAANNIAGTFTECELKCEGSSCENLTQNYVLLPIWFLNYRFKGINYSFVINGQTGEAAGDIPYDEFKRKREVFMKILPGLLAIFEVLAMLFVPKSLWDQLWFPLAVIGSFAALMVWLAVIAIRTKAKQERSPEPEAVDTTLDAAPAVEQYYDNEHKADVKGKDTFLMVQNWVVDPNDLRHGGYWM